MLELGQELHRVALQSELTAKDGAALGGFGSEPHTRVLNLELGAVTDGEKPNGASIELEVLVDCFGGLLGDFHTKSTTPPPCTFGESRATLRRTLNMEIKIQMTYSTTTHESAEHGDFADHGFYGPGGWKYSIADEDFYARVERDGREKALADMTPEPESFESVEDAVDFIAGYGSFDGIPAPVAGCLSLYQADAIQDRAFFEDGEHTRLCLHVEAPDSALAEIIDALT